MTTHRTPERRVASARFAATVAVTVTLAPERAPTSPSHPFRRGGYADDVSFETPNERRGRATTFARDTWPAGVEARAEAAPPAGCSTSRTAVPGGQAAGSRVESTGRPLAVRASHTSGRRHIPRDAGLRRRQVSFAGAPTSQSFLRAGRTPAPAPPARTVAAAAGLALLAASFLRARRLRRGTLQER